MTLKVVAVVGRIGFYTPRFGFESRHRTVKQEPAIPAFSIPILILRLFLCLVHFDTDTDTRKSQNFDSDSDTDTKVKQVL